MRHYTYLGCCVDMCGRDVQRLQDMVDAAVDVTYATVAKHIGIVAFQDTFPCYAWGAVNPGVLRLKDDWSVSYHRSKWDGRRCYYVCHSSIEYIWILDNRT